MQKGFGDHTDILVGIIKSSKKFLVGRQTSLGVPLHMTGK